MPPTIDSLLRFGYFPKEVPPVFSTASLADYIAANPNFSPVKQPGKKGLITRSAKHVIARPGNQRRRLSVPNPLNYLLLTRLIEKDWHTISTHLQESRLSLSSPVDDPKKLRSQKPSVDGGDLPIHRARVRRSSGFLLRADISHFYASVYTHSIPWALGTKASAKANRSGGLGNELDRLTRDMQDGQTLGIPTGPDTSLILGEIIACAIDRDLQRKRLAGFRFIDDFELSFTTRAAAESAGAYWNLFLQNTNSI